MDKPYHIIDFGLEALIESFLSNEQENTLREIQISKLRKNSHIKFIYKLLDRELKCQTIIVEYNYTDLDYLDDFAFYHVRCHEKYKSVCTRLHFFSKRLTEQKFLKLLDLPQKDKQVTEINKFYLGFIVVRPLPKTIVGRTILSPPKIENMTYFCTKQYSANLFGLQFLIPNSLAFQQQDRAVAACATIALWSAFHKVSELFVTSLPKASTITKSATASYSEQRSFPSSGLTIQQMRNAITSLGLETQIQQGNLTELMPAIYAYMNMNIPIILNISIVEKKGDEECKYIGEHAITLVGYKNGDRHNDLLDFSGINIKNNFISHLSVHDDQIGPFALLSVVHQNENQETTQLFNTLFDNFNVPDSGTKKLRKNRDSILLSYENDDEKLFFIASGLLIPIYAKIRVSFTDIYEHIKKINAIVRSIYIDILSRTDNRFSQKSDEAKYNTVSQKLEWEIVLTTNNVLKQNIKDTVDQITKTQSEQLSSDRIIKNARTILLKQHPKYMWCVSLKDSQTKTNIFDIYADATGTPHAFPMYGMMWYEDGTQILFKKVIDRSPGYLDEYSESQELQFLKTNLK
jgi:hypothetical protein